MKPSLPDVRTKWPRVVAVVLLVVLYFGVPNARPDFTRFNANDSEDYLALSWNLSHGRGYTRSLIDGLYIPHTTWPPGTPFLMLPATYLSGRTINWYLVKWSMCVVGLGGVWLTWRYVRRLTDSRFAFIAALLVGLNPIYWDFSHQAMAEVPLTVWLILGLYIVDVVWARRSVGRAEAFAAGLCCGLGMLLKGHAVGLLLAPLGYALGSRRSLGSRAAFLATWLIFASGFVLPQVGWMARSRATHAAGFDGLNQARMLLAVEPTRPDSRLASSVEFERRIVSNIRDYAIYRVPEEVVPGLWPEATFTWRGSGLVALPLCAVLLALAWPRRTEALPALLTIIPIAALNLAFASGGSPRYWLPVAALLTLAIVLNRRMQRVPRTLPRWLPVAAACVLFANLGAYITWHERHPYNESAPWRELAGLFSTVANRTDLRPRGVLTQNASAFQLMTGLPAPWGRDDIMYDYAVLDSTRSEIEGAHVVAAAQPWVLVALPRPMSAAATLDATRNASAGAPGR